MVCVTWNDSKAFVQWLSRKTGQEYRLPSEAEWEYADRARTTSRYWWGDDNSHTEQCLYANGADRTAKRRFSNWSWAAACADGYVFTAPVGRFTSNSFGLYDMNGNVWQWLEDTWHDNYKDAPSNGIAWITKAESYVRVVRGGSWCGDQSRLRSAERRLAITENLFTQNTHEFSSYDFGFRLARTVNP